MKNLPEIDPEVSGLLEEIVRDPRSSMRLAPRRALLSWFATGESFRPREVSLTSVERHLVEVYREDLAELLYQAAVIAFWKPGRLKHRPLWPDGSHFDAAAAEVEWRRMAERRTHSLAADRGDVELLTRCLRGIVPEDAHPLATASYCLAPNDRTGYCVAASLPEDQPRTAIAALVRLAGQDPAPSLLARILRSLGARRCAVGLHAEAREAYRESVPHDSGVIGRSYSFNLSCLLEEEQVARFEAEELGRLARPDDFRLLEARDILRQWLRQAGPAEALATRRTALRLSAGLPEPVAVLCQAYDS